MSSPPRATANDTGIDPPATLVSGDADATLGAEGLPSGDEERHAREPTTPSLVRGVAIGRHLIVAELGRGAHGRVYSAYDADLDRRVAIKVLLGARSGEGRGVLLREAQALAKVHHPNVVAVFDVGTHEGLLYLAMEYFEGLTLRAWCSEKPREPDEILDVVVQAGRGLVAAHACGVVHGDFKPDNVLVGSDGSVRVVDFGLARTVRATSPASEDRAAGTPGYMAPEVWSGHEPDMRSDQFSFCVAVFEALYGNRPFRRDTLPELGTAILEGRIDEPATIRGPRRLLEPLRRGLAVDPNARHASLVALLDQIAGARRRRWPIFARAGGITAAAFGVWLVARTGDVDDSGCVPGSTRVAEVWNPKVSTALRLSSPEVAAPFTRAAIAQTRESLDDYASRWASEYDALCPAFRAARSDDTVSLARSSCLEGRLDALGGLVEFVESHDVSPLDAGALVETLPDVTSCGAPDVVALAPVASDPIVASEVREIEARIDQLGRQMTNDVAADRAEVDALVERARATDHAHTIARALLVRGRAIFLAGEALLAEAEIEEALAIAMGAGDDTVAMSAVLRRLAQDRPGLSGDLAPWFAIGRGVVARLGDPKPARGDLYYLWAIARMRRGSWHEAVLAFDDARAAYAQTPDGPSHLPKIAVRLGRCYLTLGRVIEAEAVLRDAEDTLDATATPRDKFALYSTRASVEGRLGRFDLARAYEERALAVALDTYAPGTAGRSTALFNAAITDIATGRLDRAARRLADSKASWVMRGDLIADAEFDLAEGLLALRTGWPQLALGYADRSLAALAKVAEAKANVLASASLRVRALWYLGRNRDVLSFAESTYGLVSDDPALALEASVLEHFAVGAALAVGDRAAVSLWLARLEINPPDTPTEQLVRDETYLWLRDRDDPQAIALAMLIRARSLVAFGPISDSVAEIDRWIDGHHPVHASTRDRG